MDSSIPSLLIERAALGELSDAELRAHQDRFGPEFDQAVSRVQAQNEAWSKAPQRSLEIKQIQARATPTRVSIPSRRWVYLSATACACMAVLFVVRPDTHKKTTTVQQGPQTQEPSFRLKGLAPHLTLHRKTSQGQDQLQSGSHASNGDLIQLSYVAAGATHGVVVSIDGRGQTTLHFPSHAQQDTSLNSDGAVPLERAYELDDAPHFERFFLVTAKGKQAPENFAQRVMDTAQSLAKEPFAAARQSSLPIPSQWSQADFLLIKSDRSK